MTEVEQLLFNIGNYILIIYGVVLGYMSIRYKREFHSQLIVVGVLVFSNLIMQVTEYQIFQHREQLGNTGQYLWYVSFTAVDLLAVFGIYQAHVISKTNSGMLSKFVVNTFIVLSVVQISRMVDRLVLETNMLEVFYKVSVVSINTVVTVSVLVSFGHMLISQYRSRLSAET